MKIAAPFRQSFCQIALILKIYLVHKLVAADGILQNSLGNGYFVFSLSCNTNSPVFYASTSAEALKLFSETITQGQEVCFKASDCSSSFKMLTFTMNTTNFGNNAQNYPKVITHLIVWTQATQSLASFQTASFSWTFSHPYRNNEPIKTKGKQTGTN